MIPLVVISQILHDCRKFQIPKALDGASVKLFVSNATEFYPRGLL